MQKKILPRNNIKIGLATPRFAGSLDLSSILSRTYILILVFISKLIQSICTAAIETMGTYLALWKTDGLYQLLDGVELQGSQAQLAGNLIYHSLIFRRTGGSVFLKILVGIALKLLDDATGNQLHITL